MMAQGTMSIAAWGISQGGFGVIASEDDQGWFGKGLFDFNKTKKEINLTQKNPTISCHQEFT